MARKIIWSDEALSDIEALADYISKDSPYYAAAFIRDIIEASRTLDDFAHRGRIVPELNDPDIRELLIGNYRLIYRITKSEIIITTLVHGARDFRSMQK